MKELKIVLFSFLGFIFFNIILIYSILLLNNLLKDRVALAGYYKYDVYNGKYGFQNHLKYSKYYYKKENDIKYKQVYNKVSKNNIGEILEYYNHFKNSMDGQDMLKYYDLRMGDIDENDYYLLYDKNNIDDKEYPKFYDYTLYFYDTRLHILHVLHDS